MRQPDVVVLHPDHGGVGAVGRGTVLLESPAGRPVDGMGGCALTQGGVMDSWVE